MPTVAARLVVLAIALGLLGGLAWGIGRIGRKRGAPPGSAASVGSLHAAACRRPMSERRHCIIGAGYAGNGVAKALKDAGIPYDQIERNEYVGGNWADSVYDSTHIISSRDSTEYGDYPMPRDYPDFPSREQVSTT